MAEPVMVTVSSGSLAPRAVDTTLGDLFGALRDAEVVQDRRGRNLLAAGGDGKHMAARAAEVDVGPRADRDVRHQGLGVDHGDRIHRDVLIERRR